MVTLDIQHGIHRLVSTLEYLTPLGDFIVRAWIAKIFFMAALTKIQSWDSTVALFTYEYQVPFLSPEAAAYIGTGLELVLPVLLLVGLGGRFIILIFFLYNMVAAISYPFLWTPEGAMGLDQHINWGLLLMMLMLHGSGKFSLDYVLRRWYEKHHYPKRLNAASMMQG